MKTMMNFILEKKDWEMPYKLYQTLIHYGRTMVSLMILALKVVQISQTTPLYQKKD